MGKRFNLFQILGFLLIFASLGLLLFSRLHARRARTTAAEITESILSILPVRTAGLPGEYSDPQMPVLLVQGQDFSCVLEFPAFGVKLPVAAAWDSGKTASYPCRFHGSVYDNTMIIGGSDQPGQLDFFPRLDLGHRVRVTDLLGAEFTYSVSRIDRSESADYDTLASGDFPLTLFVRSAYSMEYILVRCSLEP